MGIKQRCDESKADAESNRQYMTEWRGLYLFRKQEAQDKRQATLDAFAADGAAMTAERRGLYDYFMGRGNSQMSGGVGLEIEADALRAEGEAKAADGDHWYDAEEPDYYTAMDCYDIAALRFNAAREKYAHARTVTDDAYAAFREAFKQIYPE